MSHSFVSNLLHCTFSTKERYPFIDSDLEARLWPYVGGIARENRMTALAIGGTADHLHALLSLPGMMSFAKAVQLIKGGSSKWVHDTFPSQKKFAWQEGYGAFSVSFSASAEDNCLYQESEGAPPQEDVRGGVYRVIEAAQYRLRFAIRILISVVRFTDSLINPDVIPPMNRWAILFQSASRTRTNYF